MREDQEEAMQQRGFQLPLKSKEEEKAGRVPAYVVDCFLAHTPKP